MTFDLNGIINAGDAYAPPRILVYATHGLGKTTFGASFKAPILLRIEDGASAIDIPTFPNKAEGYADISNAINALHGEHRYKTLVLDSLDWAEPLVQKYTCDRLGINALSDIGYGGGYIEADSDWRYLMGGLDSLRLNKGMNIVLIAHAEVKKFEPPDGEAYERYQIKLQKRNSALWQEWVDAILFCNYQRSLIAMGGSSEKNKKFRADSTGERVIYTEERPAYTAKNHWSLPPSIYIGHDKAWSAFHQALHAATRGNYPLPEKARTAAPAQPLTPQEEQSHE